MPKTIFHTTEKSNFVLNMDIEWYKKICSKMLLIVLWVTAVAAAVNQLTYSVGGELNDMLEGGGFGMVLALIPVALRSVATIFSIAGVAALIAMVVGLMRMQWTKGTLVPYCMLVVSLVWAMISVYHSFDMTVSLFGADGRDEGWIALFMYAGLFYLGTMLRTQENQERFVSGVLVLGIVNGVWALLQAQPWLQFPNEYKMVEPLLYQNLRLPSGLTDSPITFAMLLAMLLCLSIPAALLAKQKKTRVLGMICAGLSMLMSFKTQTIAGLIAGIGGLLLMIVLLICKGRKAAGKAWVMPLVVLLCAGASLGWTYVTPSLNGAFFTADNSPLENGFALYDGGIVWDDGFYRVAAAGPYSPSKAEGFDINDAASTLRYCRAQGWEAVKKYPVLGAGPDNFSFTQLRTDMQIALNPNALDRPYNDYIFIASTRGVLSLVLHLALLIACVVLAWRKRKAVGGWLVPAALCAVALYSLTALVGISVLTVAPLFWMLLGVVAAAPPEKQAEPKKAAPKEKQSATQKQKKKS